MIHLNKIHHIAVICSDYRRSIDFYTRVLGLELVAEYYREARQSWKADLALNGTYVVELFSFPSPPPRPSYPEAAGLRHLVIEVGYISGAATELEHMGVEHEQIRIDEYTGHRFFFLQDPDGLPIEIYER